MQRWGKFYSNLRSKINSVQATLRPNQMNRQSSVKNEGLQPTINGCRNNDRRCQKALYDRFYGYALSVALPYCGRESEAREVLNDAFLKVFTSIGRYDETLPFTPWLRAIVIRTAINHYHKHLHDLDFDDLTDGIEVCVEDDYLLRVEAEELLALVQKLSPAYRMTLNLHALEGYTHQEIADSLGVSVGASKSNLSKARTKLKQMMTDQLINGI